MTPRELFAEIRTKIKTLELRANDECQVYGTTKPETIREIRQLRRIRDGKT